MAVNESIKTQNKLPGGYVSSLFSQYSLPQQAIPLLFSAGLKVLGSKGKATLKTEAGGGKPLHGERCRPGNFSKLFQPNLSSIPGCTSVVSWFKACLGVEIVIS